MRFFIISLLFLASSAAMADGFRCQGQDFRVKLFNEVQPSRGTRNPAILVVSERGIGTIATLDGAGIKKKLHLDTVTYDGQANSRIDGRFVYVKLEISKRVEAQGPFLGLHVAKLTVNANSSHRTQVLACDRYRKQE